MKRSFVAIAILLIFLPLLAKAQTSNAKSEEILVRQTVESYINKTTQSVLHPDAKIISVDGSGKGFSEVKINKPFKPQKGVITVESQQKFRRLMLQLMARPLKSKQNSYLTQVLCPANIFNIFHC